MPLWSPFSGLTVCPHLHGEVLTRSVTVPGEGPPGGDQVRRGHQGGPSRGDPSVPATREQSETGPPANQEGSPAKNWAGQPELASRVWDHGRQPLAPTAAELTRALTSAQQWLRNSR